VKKNARMTSAGVLSKMSLRLVKSRSFALHGA
jgi:hypothetical protein